MAASWLGAEGASGGAGLEAVGTGEGVRFEFVKGAEFVEFSGNEGDVSLAFV